MERPTVLDPDRPKCSAETTPQSPERARKAKWLLALFMFLVCGELVSRAFWSFDRGAPLLSLNTLWYAYYPQFRTSGVEDAAIVNSDATYDVLILGGSTISEPFGPIGKELGDGLAKRLGRPVRVYNLAFPAHNSRDSLLKHRRLANQHFDLVVLYDGINDARMNNVPPGKFEEDYSHCSWYKHLNLLDRRPLVCKAALPFTLVYTADRVAEQLGLTSYLPRMNPRPDLVEFGKEVRTRGPFNKHYEEMVQASKKKGERVVLMTFAYHLPKKEADPKQEFGGGKSLVEIWGKQENVAAAVDQHNDALRALAVSHPDVIFVDQHKLMERSPAVFLDCCHFTPAGCGEFARHILDAIPAP